MKRILAFFLIILMVVPAFMIVGAEPIGQEAQGYDIYEIQYILKKFGYFTNDCTGYFGEATAQAVKKFQSDKGIEATGIADDDTVAILRNANCAEATVTIKTRLNVRENANSESEVIDSLTRNSKVNIYSEQGDWYHVETESGILGFVLKKYLTPGDIQGLTGEITGVTDAVNVRTKPEINATVAFKVSNDNQVSIIGGTGDWFQIVHEGKSGYVFKQYVSIGAEGGASTVLGEVMDPFKASITSSSLKVRSGPSTGYDVITTINKGTTFTVLGKSGNWYYVELKNGTKGYASSEYIQKGSGYSTCTVNASSSVNVRKGPGTTYEVVTTVKKGEVVTLLDDSGSWYKIKTAKGKEGYISGEYVKLGGSLNSNDPSVLKPDGTFKSGSQGSDVVTIQNRLKKLGYFTGNATGYYGSATTASVKAFQSANGLSADGKCGTKTLDKLFSSSAIPKSNANSTPVNPGANDGPAGNTGTELGRQIAEYSKNFLGVPYLLGGNGPKVFDCSGFTKYVYAHFGISIPRTAYTQGYWNKGTKITSISALQIGDLVFFNTMGDSDLCDHAGIYLGNGQIIHASSGSARKVVISNFSQSYYKSNFSWGRRVI